MLISIQIRFLNTVRRTTIKITKLPGEELTTNCIIGGFTAVSYRPSFAFLSILARVRRPMCRCCNTLERISMKSSSRVYPARPEKWEMTFN